MSWGCPVQGLGGRAWPPTPGPLRGSAAGFYSPAGPASLLLAATTARCRHLSLRRPPPPACLPACPPARLPARRPRWVLDRGGGREKREREGGWEEGGRAGGREAGRKRRGRGVGGGGTRIGRGWGHREENADEEKALHWMEDPPPGHPLYHTMPPPCPGSPWAQETERREAGRPEEKAMLLGAEGYREPSRPREVGQGPQTPKGQRQGKAQRQEKGH